MILTLPSILLLFAFFVGPDVWAVKYLVTIAGRSHRDSWTCTGAIISSKYVMTAANCVQSDGTSNGTIVVTMGNESTSLGINHALSHYKYHNEYFSNDLAVILWSRNSTKRVKVATLPLSSYTPNTDGALAFVHTPNVTSSSRIKVKIISIPLCKKIYSKSSHTILLWQHKICVRLAEGKRYGMIRSGDVLVDRHGTVIGIASFGCHRHDDDCHYPFVFTRISSYATWLAELTALDLGGV